MAASADVAVIGGGMAGASAAYELAAHRKVVLLERETFCGYHSTGRSAASFTENYGNSVIRRLAGASRAFFENPPPGFSETPLVAPRGILTIARADQLDALAEAFAEGRSLVPDLVEVAPADAIARVPILRREYLAGAFLAPRSRDIDVHAAHQGFLKGLKARGGVIVTDAEVTSLQRRHGKWRIATPTGEFAAAIAVNAAGAWAEEVGQMAGARAIGLTPRRRTALTIELPAGMDPVCWPLVDDVGAEFYFKPEAGRLLVSPADATPSPPTDAQPEDIDVALALDQLQQATTLRVERVARKWAGLRSFVADGSPVIGWDGVVDGLFWLAAQGGYGIKTAPALARAAAALIERDEWPEELRALGLGNAQLAPARCRGDTV
jgi:D-arginine dehydrogenase